MKLLFVFTVCLSFFLNTYASQDGLAYDPLSPEWDIFTAKGEINWNLIKQKLSSSKVPEVQQFASSLAQIESLLRSVDPTKVSVHPDAYRTVCEVIQDKGYPCEQHVVNTEDGYNIRVFRVPHGFNNTGGTRPPVLLSHGLIDAAGSWVLNYADRSLPYLLADAGFEVWLGNVRANKHSEPHDEHDEWDKKNWAFTFDEQGKYDVPNTIDYIRSVSGQNKVAVVGHSQGCAQLFSALHQHPTLHEKLSFFGALAPAGFFKHNTNVLIHLGAHLFLAEILETLGSKKFLRLSDAILEIIPATCQSAPQTIEFFIGLLCGYNPGETDYERYGVMCGQSLGMTSTTNMVHWAQLVRTSEFKMHDYGFFGNEDRYGQRQPPHYNLTAIVPSTLPIGLWYGERDSLVHPRDVEDMTNQLPVPPVFTRYIPNYGHLDFIHGYNAVDWIYKDLVSILRQYTQ